MSTTLERRTTPMKSREWLGLRIDLLPTVAAVAIFLAMVLYGQFTYGGILRMNTISNLFINNSHLIIIAVGMTFVILTGGIDLSVGAVIAFSSVAGVMLMNTGINGWLVILLMIGIGALFGLGSGVLVQYFDVQPFIATLAMMVAARGLAERSGGLVFASMGAGGMVAMRASGPAWPGCRTSTACPTARFRRKPSSRQPKPTSPAAGRLQIPRGPTSPPRRPSFRPPLRTATAP